MKITDQDFDLLRKHCKVDHHSEDDLLKAYYEWAFDDIASAVTDDYKNHIDWFANQTLFKRAVFPLAAYYFENRIAYIERSLSYAPHMVLSTVHKLRDMYVVDMELDKDENKH
ncbi:MULTISPECIES: head-tail connector protein [unclassified Mammaliicoccus]|uniref:head-tail connector protein n=1 Tax=unclassified Mammaliicoccus TaxID=2803851 RepID=UPI001EFA983D|nr:MULTISPECIES: head-tail connector protein [unclassified Mammaliicoccus]